MDSLKFALLSLCLGMFVLYVIQRAEQTIGPINMKEYDVISLSKLRFDDFDIIYEFDSAVIQFMQALPASHMSIILNGSIVTISHRRGLEIRKDVKRYLRDIFRRNPNIRMAIQKKDRGVVPRATVTRLFDDLCKRPIQYWHRYWYRLLQTNVLLYAGSPRPPRWESRDKYYCTELVLNTLVESGIFHKQTDKTLMPGELIGNLDNLLMPGFSYKNPQLFYI